jgi:hypothetical protein
MHTLVCVGSNVNTDSNVYGLSSIEAVAEWMLFSSADAKYRAYVAVSDQTSTRLRDQISDYTGTFELSAIESKIFGINAEDVNALYWAYERYENLIGTMDSFFLEFRDQERLDYSAFFSGEREWDFGMAVGFMATACKLPQPKCMAWVCKIVSANLRGGLYEPYDPLDH